MPAMASASPPSARPSSSCLLLHVVEPTDDRISGNVPAVLHHRLAAAVDRLDGGIVGREQPVIEQAVALEAGIVQHHEIGPLAGRNGATVESCFEQATASRARGIAQHVALSMDETLAVLQGSELVGSGNTNVGIRADAQAATLSEEGRHVEQPV